MDNSFLAPLFFAHFLRLRYYLSPPTRQAFAWVSDQIDHGIGHPSCPAPIKKGVTVTRDLVGSFPHSRACGANPAQIIRYSESVLQVSGAAPGAAGVPPAAAGATGARPAAGR